MPAPRRILRCSSTLAALLTGAAQAQTATETVAPVLLTKWS